MLARAEWDPGFWGGLRRTVPKLDPSDGWATPLLLSDATSDLEIPCRIGAVIAEPFLESYGGPFTTELWPPVRSHPSLRTVLNPVNFRQLRNNSTVLLSGSSRSLSISRGSRPNSGAGVDGGTG